MGELADDPRHVRGLASKRPGCSARRRRGGGVGVLVLLLANEHPGAEVGPGVAQALAALGVTSVSVLRDEQTTAVALEGWAFDSDRSAEAAARAITADASAVRVLRPVVESAVHPAPTRFAGRRAAKGQLSAGEET